MHNPAIFNKSIKEIGGLNSYPKFVISRLWRDGNVSIPTSEKIIKEGDRLLVITSEKNTPALTVLFGEQEHTDWNKEDIDWNAIDSQLISQRIVVTRPELNGKKLGSLHLRNHYGINISRVYRSGVQLLATAELTLQLGDRLDRSGRSRCYTKCGEEGAGQCCEKPGRNRTWWRYLSALSSVWLWEQFLFPFPASALPCGSDWQEALSS